VRLTRRRPLPLPTLLEQRRRGGGGVCLCLLHLPPQGPRDLGTEPTPADTTCTPTAPQ
jgi:hypothetical protein